MRAGLLSEPGIIQLINDRFASTWILKQDMKSLANQGDTLAQELAANFEHPLDLMFLTPEGRLISKLNSFQDFPLVHPDVSTPPFVKKDDKPLQTHTEVFLEHVALHVPKDSFVGPVEN